MRILYLTDPGISAKFHINLLSTFLADNSRKYKPDFYVVSGDYIEVPELLEQHMFKILVEQRGMTKDAARAQIEAEKSKPGIPFFRPAHPPIPEPWYNLEQMFDLYFDMIKAIESNTDNAVILNAGNHDVKVLQEAVKSSTSRRVFNPEFTVLQINGFYVGGMPGSGEGIKFLNVPNYTWNDATFESSIPNLVQRITSAGKLDLLVTHMPPYIEEGDQILGYGTDKIPDWDLLKKRSIITSDGKHVGYPLIRQIVELANPSLVLSGHIEEARHKRVNEIHSGAVDRIGNSVVVNPGGFWPNWFENQPAGVLVDYERGRVTSVAFVVGNEVVHSINNFNTVPRRIRSIEDML